MYINFPDGAVPQYAVMTSKHVSLQQVLARSWCRLFSPEIQAEMVGEGAPRRGTAPPVLPLVNPAAAVPRRGTRPGGFCVGEERTGGRGAGLPRICLRAAPVTTPPVSAGGCAPKAPSRAPPLCRRGGAGTDAAVFVCIYPPHGVAVTPTGTPPPPPPVSGGGTSRPTTPAATRGYPAVAAPPRRFRPVPPFWGRRRSRALPRPPSPAIPPSHPPSPP